jgi:replicative DNA helicase
MSKLVEMQKSGTDVYKLYDEALGGTDKIRIKDIHDWYSNEVEDYLKQQNPGLIVMDMIDNIQFTGMRNNDRTDETLEHMYQWARKLGVKLNCPVMATSQISVEGEGMQFPLQSMLKDSKTGKQGAADYIVMMGTYAEDKQSSPNRRYIGTPKNKLYREGMNDPQFETYLKADTSRIEAR